MTKTFSNRWAAVNLDCQTEHEAALATVHFLETVREALLSNKQSVHKLALQVAFSDFDSKHLEFILATVGSGEVRAVVADRVKLEETAIEGLWRVQQDGIDRFEVVSVPPVLFEHLSTKIINADIGEVPEGVFAGPAIVRELALAQQQVDLSKLSSEPAYTVEMTRQPLSTDDGAFIINYLGQGQIDISISGFARAHIKSTSMKGIWRNRIFNNAGKALFDAFVVTQLPPEVAETPEEMKKGADHCEEILKWLKDDLQSGRI